MGSNWNGLKEKDEKKVLFFPLIYEQTDNDMDMTRI